MYNLEKRLIVQAPIRKVWSALTKQAALRKWMGYGNGVEINLEVGGTYCFFDGENTGVFTEIYPPTLLEFTWRKIEWEETWPDSLVRIELKDFGKETEVRVYHKNLPTEEEWFEHDEFWDLYFLQPMKEWSETGFRVVYGVTTVKRMRA